MENIITEDLLIKAGFSKNDNLSNLLAEYQLNNYGIDDFKHFCRWTDDVDSQSPIKIDIDNGYNNRGSIWHLHIDNNDCETIGSADISTIDQFNKIMEIFDSNFRL